MNYLYTVRVAIAILASALPFCGARPNPIKTDGSISYYLTSVVTGDNVFLHCGSDYECSMVKGTPSQGDAWSVFYKGNNIYRIYGNFGKWVLDKHSNGYNIFADTVDSTSLTGESWTLESWSDGSYRLVGAYGIGAYLDVKDNQTPFMNTITTRTDLLGQHWYFATTSSTPVTNTVVSRTTAPPVTVTSQAPPTTAISTAPTATVISTAPGTTAISTAPGTTQVTTDPGTTLIVVPGPTETSTATPTDSPSAASSSQVGDSISETATPTSSPTQGVSSALNSNAFPPASSTPAGTAASVAARNHVCGALVMGIALVCAGLGF